MRVRALISCCALLALALAWGPAPTVAADKHAGGPESVRNETLASSCAGGDDLCVDVWKMSCASAYVLHADVTDNAADGLDTLIVTLFGKSPTKINGKASTQITAPGGTTPSYAELSVLTNQTMVGYVLISSLTGNTSYSTNMHCHKKVSGVDTVVDPGTITLIQDR